jgi:hypothetical protein
MGLLVAQQGKERLRSSDKAFISTKFKMVEKKFKGFCQEKKCLWGNTPFFRSTRPYNDLTNFKLV